MSSEVKTLEVLSQSYKGLAFEKQRLDSISITESELVSCSFDEIKSKRVSLGGGVRQTKYIECIFNKCDFTIFALGNVLFDRCLFQDCKLSNLFSVAGEFVDCDFRGTTLKSGSLNHKVPSDYSGPYRRKINRVERNNFSRSTLIDFDFRGGVILVESLLPMTSECIFVHDTCAAAKRLSDMGHRGGVQKLLNHYCSDGQRQQLLYPPFTKGEREVLLSTIAV